ncbi:unnamed protein product [Knipowitschia caucasica]
MDNDGGNSPHPSEHDGFIEEQDVVDNFLRDFTKKLSPGAYDTLEHGSPSVLQDATSMLASEVITKKLEGKILTQWLGQLAAVSRITLRKSEAKSEHLQDKVGELQRQLAEARKSVENLKEQHQQVSRDHQQGLAATPDATMDLDRASRIRAAMSTRTGRDSASGSHSPRSDRGDPSSENERRSVAELVSIITGKDQNQGQRNNTQPNNTNRNRPQRSVNNGPDHVARDPDHMTGPHTTTANQQHNIRHIDHFDPRLDQPTSQATYHVTDRSRIPGDFSVYERQPPPGTAATHRDVKHETHGYQTHTHGLTMDRGEQRPTARHGDGGDHHNQGRDPRDAPPGTHMDMRHGLHDYPTHDSGPPDVHTRHVSDYRHWDERAQPGHGGQPYNDPPGVHQNMLPGPHDVRYSKSGPPAYAATQWPATRHGNAGDLPNHGGQPHGTPSDARQDLALSQRHYPDYRGRDACHTPPAGRDPLGPSDRDFDRIARHRKPL